MKDKNMILYKIIISIFFGFLGFFINFHTIIFPFGEYTAVILIGLLFPMLITLSWGWKYGLLSALVGGSQSMWWLWGPSNGYATFFVVPPFTLWILWHGVCANLRKKQKKSKWWMSMYMVEIPFRILSTINLYTLCRWAITLNPPSWSWAANAPNVIPMHFSDFVVIKQTTVGFIILLFADVLLNFKNTRQFFKLKEYIDYKKTGFIISAFLLLGCLFWLFDSVFYSLAFSNNYSFLELLALNIPFYNVFVRISFFIFCLICGLFTSRLLRRQRESDVAKKESEIKYKALYDYSKDAIMILNMKLEYIDGNTASIKLFGCKNKKELIFKNIPNLSSKYQLDGTLSSVKSREMMRIAIEKGSHFFEWTHKRIDGKEFLTNVLLTKMELNGKIVLQATVRDITERKQAEEELKKLKDELEVKVAERTGELKQKTAELETVNKELEAFNYSVSHDLRAPLRSMDGFSVALLQEYSDKLDEEGKDYLNRIQNASQKMGKLIEDLLSLSRIIQYDIRYQTIDLTKIVRSIVAESKKNAPDRKVNFIINEASKIQSDKQLLNIAMNNLIGNAWKFTGKQSNARIEFGVTKHKGEKVYFIQDNGAGFDMAYADKLFGTFQRLHSEKDFPGTGIGLAIVKRIFNRLGIRIWAEAKVGKGAAFYFVLPKEKFLTETQRTQR